MPTITDLLFVYLPGLSRPLIDKPASASHASRVFSVPSDKNLAMFESFEIIGTIFLLKKIVIKNIPSLNFLKNFTSFLMTEDVFNRSF